MLAIIQARMSSKRLPGKVLKEIHNKPLLCWTIDRVLCSYSINRVIVGTSSSKSDDPIKKLCDSVGITCYRYSLNDVASRFYKITKKENISSFVRISGDSPLIDSNIIDQAVNLYELNCYDLVTNVMIRTFPKGQSVEVLNTGTFFKVYENMSIASDKEHITPPYYRSPEKYKIVNFTSGKDSGKIQLSVDTHEDFLMTKKIFKACYGKPGNWYELIGLKKSLKV